MDTSARLLRPIETPSTTASSITIAVAIKVIESVIIVSCHRPVHKMTASHTSVTTAGRQPPRTYATASSTRDIPPWRLGHQVLQRVDEQRGDGVLEPDRERVDVAHEPVGELVDV